PTVPELYESFPSRITFSWVTPLILHGFKKPLTEDDCWQLQISERVTNVVHQASVSNKRLQKFLNHDEIDEFAVARVSIDIDGNVVKIVDGSFRWSNFIDDPLILKNINLKIRQGSLVALVGSVGSGKSSILAALLGEMTKVDGQVSISGNIAYVPQTAWIMNATLQQNILFGRDLKQMLYDQVIEVCALEQDLNILPQQDQTEIGEKVIITTFICDY
ncbi:unnamed protein product, partial [Rotaria sordida]